MNNLRNTSVSQYSLFLKNLEDKSRDTERIKETVDETINNINSGVKSFAIYGEPQSGKTEMMIALTARLLDEKHKIVIILVNDIVQLLNQNLDRFKSSCISPAALDIEEIKVSKVDSKNNIVIFCKKNHVNLENLIKKLKGIDDKVIIDDEADYATPNAKINKKEKTKINKLTEELIGESGIYIGVTATPARLDLNNTHQNQSEKWVFFPPHKSYIGADIFFPEHDQEPEYKIKPLPDSGDDPKHLREALYRFMATVAYLNLYKKEINEEGGWSFLIHTTGRIDGHEEDEKIVRKLFTDMEKEALEGEHKHFSRINNEIVKLFPDANSAELRTYIFLNFRRREIIVMNSGKRRLLDGNSRATNPKSPFTVVIGGNIISRGVTFNNLISMFFTRDVKHKISQDTYIQRARMFGSRKDYIKYFELIIPKHLFYDWVECFVYHRLSLETGRTTGEAPIWIDGGRIVATQASSIDSKSIFLNKGELSFKKIENIKPVEDILKDKSIKGNFLKLEEISKIDNNFLPTYLLNYIKKHLPEHDDSIAIYGIKDIEGYKEENGSGVSHESITRDKGFIGGNEMKAFEKANHHFMIRKNKKGNARLFYKHKTIKLRFLSRR